jgi:hypothetical protein
MLSTFRKWVPVSFLALLFLAGAVLFRADRPARAADAQTPNTLTDKEKTAGWKLLFDGQTTNGWRAYRGKNVPDKWQVVDGALALRPRSGKQGGDIITVDEFDNFELSLEWKIAEGGNSGIMYRVIEEPGASYESGPEYQLLDNAKHPDGRSSLTSAASCYALYAPSEDATKPVGQWNHARLVVNGRRVEHWLNGKKVVTYKLGSRDWNKRVKASKFKDMSHFGKEPRGHICLQDHGDQVEFRNIKIRPLGKKRG